MASQPYENVRLRRSLAGYPSSDDPEFLDAIRSGRVYVLWETPEGAKAHIWLLADRTGGRTSAFFTSVERLRTFHDNLPAPLQTSAYAMIAGPSAFSLLRDAGVDDVRTDPDFPEEAHISKQEVAEVVALLEDSSPLQMRVIPFDVPPSAPPQASKPKPSQPPRSPRGEQPASVPQRVAEPDQRVDTLSSVPLAMSVMVPLLERRVDDAWEAVARLVVNGQSDEAIRAVALLLWALLDNGARAAGDDPIALLQEGAQAWMQYAQLGEGKEVVDVTTMRQLVNEPCGLCTHAAVQHDAAWTLWEYGSQTDGVCLEETCACQGFESRV